MSNTYSCEVAFEVDHFEGKYFDIWFFMDLDIPPHKGLAFSIDSIFNDKDSIPRSKLELTITKVIFNVRDNNYTLWCDIDDIDGWFGLSDTDEKALSNDEIKAIFYKEFNLAKGSFDRWFNG